MALVKCKECGGEISKKARTCPHCGYKKKNIGWEAIKVVWLVFFLTVIILAVWAAH